MGEQDEPSTLADCMDDYDEAEVEEWTPRCKKGQRGPSPWVMVHC